MKPLYTLIIVLTVAAIGCAPKESSLETLQAELQGLETQKKDLESRMAELATQIASLDTAAQQTEMDQTLVTVVKAKKKRFVYSIQVPGRADSRQNIVVSAESMGSITRIYAVEGQIVNKGQTIATIDNESTNRQVAEMESRLALAKDVYEKQQRLWDKKIGTELQYLQAKNNYEALVQGLAALKAQAAKSVITAPIAGYIDELFVREGQTVAMGTPALRLVDLANIRITAQVSEKYVAQSNNIDSLDVKFPSIGQSYKLKVSNIGKVVNSDNRTFMVETEMRNPGQAVKPNVLADVFVPLYKNQKAVVVPTNLVQHGKDSDYIYVAANEGGNLMAQKRQIVIGHSYRGETEVLNGLSGGEQLIAEGSKMVADKEPIRLAEAN